MLRRGLPAKDSENFMDSLRVHQLTDATRFLPVFPMASLTITDEVKIEKVSCGSVFLEISLISTLYSFKFS